MSSKKWVLLMLTLSGIYTPSLSQLGVPGMEYVEYLRTEPRKSVVSREDSEYEISVPKYRSQDDTLYMRQEDTGANNSQRRQDVNIEENTKYRSKDDRTYRRQEDTGANNSQRRQDVNVDEIAMYRSQENSGTEYRSQENTGSNYRSQENTGAKIFQRRRRLRVRPRQDENVDEFGSREFKKSEDENNQDKTKKKNSFSDYDYDTDTNNSIERISADSLPTVTEIYSEIDKVIPQSDIFKVTPKDYNRNYGVADDAPCRGSECYLQATQESYKQSPVYQNYEDNASNQNIMQQSTEGAKQYVKMVRIPTTTSNSVEDTIIYQQQPISNPVEDTIIYQQQPLSNPVEDTIIYQQQPLSNPVEDTTIYQQQPISYPVEDTIIYQQQPISNPVQDTIVHEQKPAFTENSPSYSTYPVDQRSTYPVGHRSGPYYAPNTGGRYPAGEVYTDNNYVHNQFQTDVYPQNTYPSNVYSQNAYSNERYDTAEYPTITNPTYDDRVYQRPSYPSNYQAGPRPMAQLYYKTKANPSSGFRPSEQFYPSNAAQQPVHNHQENLRTEPLPIQHNSYPYSEFSDSSIHRYSRVRPDSQVRPESQAREDYKTNKKPTYRAPRYIRPSSLNNYDYEKVPKQIDLKKQVVTKQVVTTPKPLDPAIEKVLRARAHKEAANRYYTGLQREIERSDIMADAVKAVRSRTHMKKVNTTKSPSKVKRSTTSNPAILSITKNSINIPETQYHKKEIEISGNRRDAKDIRVLSNSRSKKDINIKSFHHNLPSHPLYKNLPGKENYDSLKITTKSPDIRQKALELKKFQKVKSQFDALVPKATYTPETYPSYPSYPGQKIHYPRPTTFRPFVIPKYNKFYKPGQYIRPAKVQVSRLYKQREYIPKYVRPESNEKDTQHDIRQSPPSSFIDIPRESVKSNPTSSYLKTSKEERPIVYHKPQIRPKYVIVRTPKQLQTSPEYTTNPKVQPNLYTAKQEYRQVAETPENTKYKVLAIQNPPRKYRAIINDDESHHIRETYSNPRQHRDLINPIPEIPKVYQSYSPKTYTTEPYSNPRQHRALVKPVTERPKIQYSYSPKPYTTEPYSYPRQHRALVKPITERPKIQHSYSPKPYTTEPYSNPRQHRALVKPTTERPKIQHSYSPKPYTTEPYSNPGQHRALVKPITERPKIQHSYSPKPYTTAPYSNPRQHRALVKPITERPKIQHSYSPKPYTTEFIESPKDKRRSMEINVDSNVNFPKFGYNIDRYFEDFPSFGFFKDE